MKYGASSSILIMDYDVDFNKFRIVKRVEVPKVEYSYDNAVNLIVELNKIYNPSWIYVDRGSGEYQIERLHIIGEENPVSGLHNKVKGFQFSNKIQVPDPVKKETNEKPMKPFMVNQLAMAFERNKIIMSPYDEVLHKQLIDYHVERISQNGTPIFTDKNEHFVDAMGLAYLAFVMEFPNITKTVKQIDFTSSFKYVSRSLQEKVNKDLVNMAKHTPKNPWDNHDVDKRELEGDRPKYFKVSENNSRANSMIGWGSRGRHRNESIGRSSW